MPRRSGRCHTERMPTLGAPLPCAGGGQPDTELNMRGFVHCCQRGECGSVFACVVGCGRSASEALPCPLNHVQLW
eukprot:204421-Chlamydomonas_euryale.AAC.2